MNDTKVAEIILKQLGGHRFLAMTGSYQLVAGKNLLGMKLRRNRSKANYLRITLNGKDLYDVQFISIRGTSMKVKSEFFDVYWNQLRQVFEEVTGFYTSL